MRFSLLTHSTSGDFDPPKPSHSIPDAIKAYQRALISAEVGDTDTATRIGRLFSLIGDSVKAAQYHRRALSEGRKAGQTPAELSKTYLCVPLGSVGFVRGEADVHDGNRWLARYEIDKEKNRDETGEEGDLLAAEEYLDAIASVQEDKDVR